MELTIYSSWQRLSTSTNINKIYLVCAYKIVCQLFEYIICYNVTNLVVTYEDITYVGVVYWEYKRLLALLYKLLILCSFCLFTLKHWNWNYL